MLTPTEPGLDARRWKEVKKQMLNTGEFNPNLWNELNFNQKFFVNELKKSLRDLSTS